MSVGASGAESPAPRAKGSSWRWSTWSLTRKLPLLAAAIVLVVVAASLALTYDALTRERTATVHERLDRLARQLVASSEQTTRTRVAFSRQIAADSAVHAVLRAANAGTAPGDSGPMARAAAAALLRLRIQPDSSLPIELWTTDGRRLVRVGTEVRGDSLTMLRPEMRALSGSPVTEVPRGSEGADSMQYGVLYSSGGKVLYWTIVPVMDHGTRIGVIAQQRAIRTTAQSAHAIKELLGNDVSLYLHNRTDRFWTTFTGEPTAPLTGVDTAQGNFIGDRQGIGPVLASEASMRGTPWIISLEAPLNTVLAEPRATLRRLLLISLFIASGGVIAAWVVSRGITSPLVSLASVSEAIAHGDYAMRMPEDDATSTRDEVARLTTTFNRMAAEIETSHRELEAQVAEAMAVSEELEQTNEQLQQLSADAEEARDEAQEANRAKSDFLAVMSHELRTPLNAIGGYAEILQLGIYGPLTERQREAIARVTRSQQMLLSLINDILNFAKLDAGHVQYRITDVPVEQALEGVEALVAPQLQAKQLHYAFTGCTEPLVVRADSDKMQQIVLNLLSNAIKFTPSGGRISLSCEAQGDHALIRVTDTGIGIAADRLEAIFDPFVQVDRALNRPHDGVGLGLSISRDLARGMGGTLTVRSSLGEGSTFTLRLRCSSSPAR